MSCAHELHGSINRLKLERDPIQRWIKPSPKFDDPLPDVLRVFPSADALLIRPIVSHRFCFPGAENAIRVQRSRCSNALPVTAKFCRVDSSQAAYLRRCVARWCCKF
jgi:hypothetical protein